MATHTIRTTMRPDVEITVDEAEYQRLFFLGLIFDGAGPLPVADFYDAEIADRIANGVATPPALIAAIDAEAAAQGWDAITDASMVGKAVLTATDAPAARTAIGAGTSSFSGAYADLSGKPTIPAAYTDEQVRDVIGTALVAGTNVTLAVNDVGDTITITAAGGSGGYADLPAGTTLTVLKAGTWPARPTSRTDIVVAWKGSDPSPAIVSSGTGGMLDNVDYRLVTP